MASEQPGSRRPPVGPLRSTSEPSGLRLSDLGLEGLRTYRALLGAEEERSSYWRRLLKARVDLVLAGAASGAVLAVDDLVRVLGDTGSGRTRLALLRVETQDALPGLPDLGELRELWSVGPGDAVAVADLVERLHAQDARLEDYCRALRDRIDAATAALISRYRDDPRAALDLLPRE